MYTYKYKKHNPTNFQAASVYFPGAHKLKNKLV